MSTQNYLTRIRQQLIVNVILHYDSASQDLRAWFWPVSDAGHRVTPSSLLDHRKDHKFRAPCCLCAETMVSYTESAVYIAVTGPYFGEYVASCALNRCGYSVCLERMYSQRGLLLRSYPKRSGAAPGPVLRLAAKPKDMGVQSVIGSLPTYERPARGPETSIEQLLRLDTSRRPGLSEAEFMKLFAKCSCGLIMTRRVFRDHICTPAVQAPPAVIIDLTAD